MAKKNSLCPIFIPHYGCPNACVFCNQHKITGKENYLTPSEIEAYFRVWKKKAPNTKGLAYYGGSFTALESAVQTAYLEVASRLKKAGHLEEIRLSTRPDYLSIETLERLKAYGVDTIEIGVQSLFDEVLTANQRGHTKKNALEAIERASSYGFQVGAQMMLGLYKDMPERSIQTAKWLSETSITMVRLYPTLVLKETMLEAYYKKGVFTPWERDKVLDTLASCIEIFSKAKIAIIRTGLQEESALYDGVVAGYHHPALGELAYSRVMRAKISALVKGQKKEAMILVSPKNLSKAIGQKRENINYFKETMGLSLLIKADDSLKDGEVRLCSSND